MLERQRVLVKPKRTGIVVPSRKTVATKEMMKEFLDHALELARQPRKKEANNPFNLLPPSVDRVRRLERTYATSFGIKLVQDLASMLANSYLGYATTNHTIHGRINTARMRRIGEVLNKLENGTKPDINAELAYILEVTSRKTLLVTVHCDLFTIYDRENGRKEVYECKSPQPNSDQTKVAKERILKLYSMEDSQIDNAYFVLNYNPYGDTRDEYSWSVPSRWFNIKGGDTSILIGKEFWDKIGGRGTYNLIVRLAKDIRELYESEITNEFVNPTDEKVSVTDSEALYTNVLKLQRYFNVK